ncbi:unnamed protein product [Heligmosomoides polygyrus]|uniref:Transcriptional regulator n=1 Tax=Heligmosomoides polygyrus TaxID=6339 RepID=A0A183GQK7_HELPZ|nr:unnamed protein product [Heligmosomoides polygyrus]
MTDVGDMSSQAGRALRDIVDTSCESGTPGATLVTPLLNSDARFHDDDDTRSGLGRPLRDIGDTSSDLSQHDVGDTSREP